MQSALQSITVLARGQFRNTLQRSNQYLSPHTFFLARTKDALPRKRRPPHRRCYHTRHGLAITIGAFFLQLKLLANSGRSCRMVLVRYSSGAWGSVWA